MHPLKRGQFFWLAAVLGLWALYGLVGRDAWKADEALALGALLDWREQARLFVEPGAPLFTLLASALGNVLAPWLDMQDAARHASALFALGAFLCTGLAARALFGPGHEGAAVLALMGCFGLMLRAHALLPETAQLMAYALLLYAIAEARDHFLRGSLLLALAFLALALLRGGLDLAAGLAIALLPWLSREWRTHAARHALALAVGVALLGVLWLAWASAGDWGRLTAAFLDAPRATGALFADLAWFAWPVWPLALWAVWYDHRRLDREFVLYPPLAAILVLFLFGHFSAYSREGGLVALLVPLALLAAKGLVSLKRGAAQALYWFGVLTFLFFALLFWAYYGAIEWGWPAKAAAHMARLTPAYVAGGVGWPALLAAAGATLAWLVAIPLFPRAKARPVLVWATGMTMAWIVMFSLFRGWADAGWGYRPLIESLARQVPARACLRVQADADMHAMLRYHLADRYRPGGACDYWLVAGAPRAMSLDGAPMRLLWSGARPRQKREVYSLYGVAR
jgi:hypothetical protein